MSDMRYKLDTHGSPEQHEARRRLLELHKATPIPDDQILVNLGLYTRSIIVAKTLYLNELYQRILPLPGIIMELGVWWGATLTTFENLRCVYEPYNRTRRVVGFDTFTGYTGVTEKDGSSPLVAEGAYATSEGYVNYLTQVLDAQTKDNVLSHEKKYEIVPGDVTRTLPQYLADSPETIVSLAYFDLGLYEPTKKCLESIRPHLIRGSILAMDELNSHDLPGETLALKEVIGLDRYEIVRSRFLPDRAYVIIG